MDHADQNLAILEKLKSMGVRLSIDDFGAGYSSLIYLERFPLDELKMNRAVFSPTKTTGADCPMITAIIAMAHSLGLTVTVEGIENAAQLTMLQEREGDVYQGAVFSKPVAADEFASLLSAGAVSTGE